MYLCVTCRTSPTADKETVTPLLFIYYSQLPQERINVDRPQLIFLEKGESN